MEIFNKKGFSLVELLVVISIIATLTAILLPNMMGARDRANDSKKKQEMTSIKGALRFFYNETQTYPASSSMEDLATTLAPFMPSINSIGYTYEYTQLNKGDGFWLRALTEATSSEENIGSQTRCGITPTDPLYYYVCAF